MWSKLCQLGPPLFLKGIIAHRQDDSIQIVIGREYPITPSEFGHYVNSYCCCIRNRKNANVFTKPIRITSLKIPIVVLSTLQLNWKTDMQSKELNSVQFHDDPKMKQEQPSTAHPVWKLFEFLTTWVWSLWSPFHSQWLFYCLKGRITYRLFCWVNW